jgi:hypothetical protein
MRLLPLSALLLLLPTCGSASGVRGPSPHERRDIGAVARETYTWESSAPPPYLHLHLRRPRLHPKVVGIRVSRSDPEYATAVVELRDAHERRRPGTALLILRKEKEPDGRWFLVDQSGTTFALGCTRATPRGIRELICPDPWSILGHRRPRIRLNTRVSSRLGSPDLHSVDWASATLPGAACGATRPIRLRHSEAYVPSAVFPWWPAVAVYAGSGAVYYGDLDGDGRDEAAVGVVCSNLGGTAAGQLAFASVIFTARRDELRSIGIITPRQPLDGAASHVPLVGLAGMKIRRGRVIAREAWYGPSDGTCCASGRARTIWTYERGRLRPIRTMVDRPPSR